MQKDVIYIDTEDDITAIIGKVKSAGSKIVALVPPKRMGVLQSAVNLKLLTRAAESAQKRIVLITNDHSLIALAAGLHMPVAKNLQSKPEVPQMTAPETAEEEVIEGKDIPVGDFAASIGSLAGALKKDKSVADEISEKVEIGQVAVEAAAQKPTVAKPSPMAALKKRPAVPNFVSFRNKLFLIGGGLVVLVVFLFWATAIAPSAKVVIAAKTTGVNIDRTLKLDAGLPASDTAGLKLKPIVQQIKKTVATEFDATGTKDIGNKASGTITVRNCDISDDFILPASTKFTGANGQVFTSTQAVTVPQFSGSSVACTQGGPTSGKASVPVQAADLGPDYNIGSQAYSVGGQSSRVDGVGSEMSGGTRETVKVVSQADVDKAKTQLPTVEETAAKAELKKQFTSEQIVIEESYEITQGNDVVTPNVGEQASRAKLTKETTLTYHGLARADVKAIVESVIADALKDKASQQTYNTGEDSIAFQAYQKNDAGVSVRLITTASIGPKIDTKQLAKELEGKRFGEVQAHVSQIAGVENVDISFSPFWVTNAPKADKIDIEFTVAEDDK